MLRNLIWCHQEECRICGTKRRSPGSFRCKEHMEKTSGTPREGTSTSISECAPRQRVRNLLPHGGRHPRPITGWLHSGDWSGLPVRYGARHAEMRGAKSAQNGDRKNIRRQSFLQRSGRLPQAASPSALCHHNSLNKRLLRDPFRRRGRSQSHEEARGGGMERVGPLLLEVLRKLQTKRTRSRKAPHTLHQGAIPWPSCPISLSQSSDHNGQQHRRSPWYRIARLIHQKAGRANGYCRGQRHQQISGDHQDPLHVRGGRHRRNDNPENSLLWAAESMQKMPKVRAPGKSMPA